MRLIALAIAFTLSAALDHRVAFEIFARPGTRFACELRSEDGGLLWRRESHLIWLDGGGHGRVEVEGLGALPRPATARFVLLGEKPVACEYSMGAPGAFSTPATAFAPAASDGGCKLVVLHGGESGGLRTAQCPSPSTLSLATFLRTSRRKTSSTRRSFSRRRSSKPVTLPRARAGSPESTRARRESAPAVRSTPAACARLRAS
jgi:hypothetical protein